MAEITLDFESEEGITEENKTEVMKYAKENWRGMLSEEHGTDPSLADTKTFDDAIKSYIHGQKMVGADKVVLPGPDASEEELSAFFNKIGRPETSDGYEFEALPDGTPENVAHVLDESKNKFRDLAHKYNLTKRQATALWKESVGQNLEAHDKGRNTYSTRIKTQEDELKQEMGDAYDGNMKLANKVLSKFADEKSMEWLKSTGIAKEPNLRRIAVAIGKGLSEDTISIEEKSQGGLDPQAAKSKINQIMADKKHAYFDKKSVGHKDALAEMDKLYAKAYPEGSK